MEKEPHQYLSSLYMQLSLLFKLLNAFVMFQRENAPEEGLLQCSLQSALNLSMDKCFGHLLYRHLI